MIPIGTAEVVWNQTSDRCPGLNWAGHIGEQPDSMPTAWHNPLTQTTSLISATDWGTFATVGPSLKELTKHDCSHRVYESINSSKPEDLASHQWLQSAIVFPNGSGAALIHSEFHGGMTGDTSLCTVQHNQGNCQYWSTGLGITKDGGDTWNLTSTPPHHFTFAVPRKFEKDSQLTGFGALGGLVLDDDGFYYGHVNQARAGTDSSDTSTNGVCAFRSDDIFDPRSFRGWNGSAWTTTWVDPYTASADDLATGDHTCAVIQAGFKGNGHPNMRKFAGDWRPEGWPSDIMLGWPEAGKSNKLAYAYPAWTFGSDSKYTEWSDAQYMDITEWLDPEIFGASQLMYPSFLDADSPFTLGEGSPAGLSYSLLGNKSAFVYFVISRKYLARIPVAFVPGDTPDPPAPFPPAPPPSVDPTVCPEFLVEGAGQSDVNGLYMRSSRLKSELPMFQMDGTHQLYSLESRWRLAYFGHSVFYTTPASADATVPSAGWGEGVEPAPTVTCVNPATCVRLSVTGAGQADVNGIYVRSAQDTSSGEPVYEKDSSHQLYGYHKQWKLAHYGVGPVYYFTAPSVRTTVPVMGWSSGISPNPIVTCVDEVAIVI